MTGAVVHDKKLRSDARRNRERLVASARQLLMSEGADVSVEEITRRAGLGMGTLYRHFATKDELIDAVLEDAFAGLVDAAERAGAADDAWEGFCGFLEQALSLHAANRGLKDALSHREHGARRDRMRARIRPVVRRLIERAQQQGTLRADFTPEDLPLVFWTAGRVIETTEPIAPGYWRRYLALLLDGLRAESSRPLPGRPLTQGQLRRAERRLGR
jgi:AcrR family transcriptional regulator